MGKFARGQVVLVRFPFSDLSGTKLRPALVLAEVEYGDLVLCQITSKSYDDRLAIQIGTTDFATGSLPVTSYARPGRLMTSSPELITRALAILNEDKRVQVALAISQIVQ